MMPIGFWLGFAALLLVMVVLDLGVLTRRPREIRPGEAVTSTVMWLVAASGFGLALSFIYQTNWMGLEAELSRPIDRTPVGGTAALVQFFTGYVVEMALSLDNVAVLTLLLAYFRVPIELAARLIFWGVLVSLVLRFGLIMGCAELMAKVSWMPYALAGLIVIAMLRLLLMPDESTDFERTPLLKAARRWLPIAAEQDGQRLLARREGRWMLTPLALVVVVAGVADLTFALDSIPAVYSVTRDPFIAFTSNAFAVLSLRSMYFWLRGVIGRFRYLKLSLVFVMLYLAGKMVLLEYSASRTLLTLGVVLGIVATGVTASVLRARRDRLRAAVAGREVASAVRPRAVEDLAEAVLATRRNLRKIVVLIAGTATVLFGALVVGPIPGPGGTVVVAAGLGLLATEFVWARTLLIKLKEQTESLAKKTDKAAETASVWWVLFMLACWIGACTGLYWVAVRWLPFAFEAFIFATAMGGSTAVGLWAHRMLAFMYKAWRAKRAARRAGAAPDGGSAGGVTGA